MKSSGPQTRQALPAALMFVSNLVRAGAQWLLVWVYALLGGPEVVGQYSLALAIVSPVFILGEMSLRNVIVTLRREVAFLTFLMVRSASIAVALAILLLIAGLSGSLFTVLVVLSLVRAADSVLDLSFGALQKRGEITRIALVSLLNSTVTACLGVLAFWLTESIALSLVGSLVGSVVTALLVVMPVLRSERRLTGTTVPRQHELGSIFKAGIPSGLAFASVSLLTYLPLYFLGGAGNLSDLGVFAALGYFVSFANLFYSSVQQSTLHTYVKTFAVGGRAHLFRYAWKNQMIPLAACGLASGLLTMLLGNLFMVSVYGPEFALTGQELAPVAVSMALLPLIYVSGAILLTRNLYLAQFVIGLIALCAALSFGLTSNSMVSIEVAGMILLVGTAARAILGVMTASIALVTNPQKSPKGSSPKLKRRNRVRVVGYYGMGNFGDDLFGEVILARANQMFPGREVKIVGKGAQKRVPQYSSSSAIGAMLRLLDGVLAQVRAQTIVLGGGSVLMGLHGVRRVQWLWRRFASTKFESLGVSIGPFPTSRDATDVAEFLRWNTRVVVRDEESLETARMLGIGDLVKHGGDLAALFESDQRATREAGSRTIGLALCNFPGYEDVEQTLLDSLVRAIATTSTPERDDEVVIISLNSHARKGDDEISRRASEVLRRRGIANRLLRYTDLGVQSTWETIASLHAMVAVRLHAAIPAYLERVPFALLEYQQKCASFCDDIGQADGLRLKLLDEPEAFDQALSTLLDQPAVPRMDPGRYVERAEATYLIERSGASRKERL